MMLSPARLCIFCRQIEQADQPCPQQASHHQSGQSFERLNLVTPLSIQDQDLLESLQKQPSHLCERCADYDLLGAFVDAEPRAVEYHDTAEEYAEFCKRTEKYEISLGNLSTCFLTPSCQLCRLIYRILPRGISDEDEVLALVPFRSFMQSMEWADVYTPEMRAKFAIFLGLRSLQDSLNLLSTSTATGCFLGESIALDTRDGGRTGLLGNARFVEPYIDFSMVKLALSVCNDNHGKECRPFVSEDLKQIKVLDVETRTVIPYPENCEYFALSYVWGGIVPPPGALQSNSLPQTIEDSIFVTKKLGRRYLWIDQLCTDQVPNPTPQQIAALQKQLAMMDQIYAGASLTLVAVAGKNSNCGLPGVSSTFMRTRQHREVINGLTLVTVPPDQESERRASSWITRAWTMQEALLSRRYLYFLETQAVFECYEATVPESRDLDTVGDTIPQHPNLPVAHAMLGRSDETISQDQLTMGMGITTPYMSLVDDYTNRSMTNATDSLNAFLGITSTLSRRLFPQGFTWGLPLRSHPQSLGWFHNRLAKPKRRPAFPSWCWAGWEGNARYFNRFLEPEGSFSILDERHSDTTVEMVSIDDHKLTVKGLVVTLNILTEPFSDVLSPKTRECIGTIMERNFLHNNTMPTGEYSGLIVSRATIRRKADDVKTQKVYVVVLEWLGGVAQRRTMVTVNLFRGQDMMDLEPEEKTITLI